MKYRAQCVVSTVMVVVVLQGMLTAAAPLEKNDNKQQQQPVKIKFVEESMNIPEGMHAEVQLVAEGLSQMNISSSITVKIGVIKDKSKYKGLRQATLVEPQLGVGDFAVDMQKFEDYFTVVFDGESDLSSTHEVWTVQDNLYEGTEAALLKILEVDTPSGYRGKINKKKSSKLCLNIIDDDVVEVSFEKDSINVTEGNSVDIGAILRGSPLNLPLELGVVCYQPLQSNLDLAYMAKEKADFKLSESASIIEFSHHIWREGLRRSSRNVTVLAVADRVKEETESFVCTFRFIPVATDPLRITHPDRVVINIIDS